MEVCRFKQHSILGSSLVQLVASRESMEENIWWKYVDLNSTIFQEAVWHIWQPVEKVGATISHNCDDLPPEENTSVRINVFIHYMLFHKLRSV